MTVSSIPTWLWGVLICVFATAATALGLVLQKLSHTLNERGKKNVVYYRQTWWLVGFTIFMAAQIVNVIPMALTPQVMLSCLGATALIFNALFACIILQEELHFLEAATMFGIVIGVVMVISTTPAAPPKENESLQDFIGPIVSWPFIMVSAFVLTFCLFLRFAVLNSSLANGFLEIGPLVWTFLSAVSSGYTVNLFKAVSQLLVTWSSTRPYLHWECYVILAIALICGVSQVHCLNCALNMGRAMVVVPTYFALALLAQLILSEVVVVCLPETPAHGVIFAAGIVVILVLVALLARAKIEYENDPAAQIDEVIERALSMSPKNSMSPLNMSRQSSPKFPPSLEPSQHSMPSMRDVVGDVNFVDAESVPLLRPRTMSSYDPDVFLDSFEGRQRSYTVSVTGGLGVG